MTEIEKLALQIATEPPLYQNKWVGEARVRWELIKKLRAALDKEGFDWRTLAKAKHARS